MLVHSGLLLLAGVLIFLYLGTRITDRPDETTHTEDWDWDLDPRLQVRRDVSRHARNLDFAGYLARMHR